MSQASLGQGVIEGFYGKPWTHSARLRMVRTLARFDLDTFLVAPKSDRRRKGGPLGALDARERDELAELGALGRSLSVAVVPGVSPERVLGKNARFDALEERLEALGELGLSRVALTFDDTWATFGRASFDRGLEHAQVTERARAVLRRSDTTAEVFVAPAIYHKRVEEMSAHGLAYLRGLGHLGGETPMAWTGPQVFSRHITGEDASRLSRVTGLPVWIWNNAVTNDWLPLATGEPIGARPWQKLSFGPVENMAAGLEAVTRGILLNGAREAALTEIPLAWLAERRAGGAFDRDGHRRAIERIVGPAATDPMLRLYDLTRRHDLSAPARFEGRELDALVRDVVAGRPRIVELELELERLGSLEGELRRTLDDETLWQEIVPTLRRVSLAAQLARLCLERARAARAGNGREATSLGRTIRRLGGESRSLRWRAAVDVIDRLASADPRFLPVS